MIVTPEGVQTTWSFQKCETNVCNPDDGKSNTTKLIAYSNEHGIIFPAAELCAQYSKNSIKPGEGFLPAINQLKQIVVNWKIINPALARINGEVLQGWIWSSSENSSYNARFVLAYNGYVDWGHKLYDRYVRCILAF